MKVLFIGGTGIISSACSRLAVERGIDLYHLNRGKSSDLRQVEGVQTLHADIRDKAAAAKALADHEWDAVVDWVAFVPDHLRIDHELFRGRTRQFVFISSASAYQKPVQKLPITEQTPLENPFWEYSRNKIACEDYIHSVEDSSEFPCTIVRPSHTYDATLLPMDGGPTALRRMLDGKPVVVHGDGTSLWVLTHHRDFAKGLVGLLGRSEAIGETYHITSDELLSWNQIFKLVAAAFGVEPKIVHVPSDVLGRHDEHLYGSLLGDKAHSVIFDNRKIKALVSDFRCEIPFSEGAKEIAAFYKANPDQGDFDPQMDALFDRLIRQYGE